MRPPELQSTERSTALWLHSRYKLAAARPRCSSGQRRSLLEASNLRNRASPPSARRPELERASSSRCFLLQSDIEFVWSENDGVFRFVPVLPQQSRFPGVGTAPASPEAPYGTRYTFP